MSFWFIDASVLLSREDVDDDQHEAARKLLAGDATLTTLDLAYYEVGNAVLAWRDVQAAARLRGLVAAIATDGGLVRADETLIAHAVRVADTEGLSVSDAGHVAGAASAGAQLVSCDLRDLVNRQLAVTPQQAVQEFDV